MWWFDDLVDSRALSQPVATDAGAFGDTGNGLLQQVHTVRCLMKVVWHAPCDERRMTKKVLSTW
jgi:hypothetical protein